MASKSGSSKKRKQTRDILKNIIDITVQGDIEMHLSEDLKDIISTEPLYVETGKKGKYVALRDKDLSASIFWKKGDHYTREKKQFLHMVSVKRENEYLTLFRCVGERYRSRAMEYVRNSEVYQNPQLRQALKTDVKTYVNLLYSQMNINMILLDEEIFEALAQNPHCSGMKQIQIHRQVLNNIPEDITLLFPEARQKVRHFILHVGDTNSGKTYDAVQDFKQAESGVYLAPLRLLALETQERMMDAGVPCSMITGEEESIIEGASHMSSTIEILNTEKEYAVAVIDEAQMIADESRGYAWTRAILGVNSERIHVCMSENALDIVKKLIFSCNDTYETIYHKRDTPLIMERKTFDFPDNVRPHDALIVFSRKNVIYVAGELERRGIPVSIIYGALPYEVRKSELSRFLTGETDVVVSTDAIGMGMNLPVERIVFLESEKFDGRSRRPLRGPEVKQIAGRAGRRGLYEKGYVNALVDKRQIHSALLEPYVPIETARIQMPERLLDLDMTLTETITSWNRVTDNGLYEKADAQLILEKCQYMEQLNRTARREALSKQEMWRFSLIPFDERNKEVYDLWKSLVKSYYLEQDPFEGFEFYLAFNKDLTSLEADYKRLDLMFSFSRAIGYNKNDFRKTIASLKSEISKEIIQEIMNVSAEKKKCKRCGRELSWNYRFNVCNRCFHEQEKYRARENYKSRRRR